MGNTVNETNPYSLLGKATNAVTKDSVKEMSDSFLKLLTTQLQYQDPLNPVENSEFTSQLAQINTVQGIQNLNSKLEAFASQFVSAQVLQAVAMLDRQILVEGSTLKFDGQNSVTGGFDIPTGSADKAVVTVYNSAGTVVDTIELGNGLGSRNTFEWDGKDSDGNALPAGNYTFGVLATSGGSTVSTTKLAYSKVESVERSADGTIWVIAGGKPVAISDIWEII